MNTEQILEYQNIRASLRLPSITEQEAIEEAQALVNIISLTLTYATK